LDSARQCRRPHRGRTGVSDFVQGYSTAILVFRTFDSGEGTIMSANPSTNTIAEHSPPNELLWIADAPLFIDEAHVGRLYNAVVAEEFRTTKVTETLGKDVRVGVAAKTDGEFEAKFPEFLSWFAPFFGFEAKASGGLSGSRDRTDKDQKAEERVRLEAPERQLLEITLHYLKLHQGGKTRAYVVPNPAIEAWRTPEYIRALPRALIFLQLPGATDADSPLTRTMLIPTAAEIEGQGVVELFTQMPGYDKAGPYPEPNAGETDEQLRDRRRVYWSAFQEGFNATKAMVAIEKAAKDGRIRWIDYRLPITDRGDTLHLHFCPAGKYDTGVFAYNLIKRGFKHGLRLVGTLKSEPDMNVLAVYDR
jgi:hypothetical protein